MTHNRDKIMESLRLVESVEEVTNHSTNIDFITIDLIAASSNAFVGERPDN
jgi:hypothetical protein